jgi:protein-L-isoaspartate(D-aspartate) O-methyltransferase
MAWMLEALELTPGMRVLEVGAGTGYNAALLAAITAAPVVTIDSNQHVVAEAQAALRRLGLHRQVTVVAGDGYHGWPAAAPYDRIMVTCGCVGLSPRWLAQLAPGGRMLVPVAHGGVHPIVAAWGEGPVVRGRMALEADFMEAAGPLGHHHPAVLRSIPADAVFTSHRQVGPVLDWQGYAALWCFLAARDRRITRAATLAEGIDPMQGMCALHDPKRGIAWVRWTAASTSPVTRCCWRRPPGCCGNGRRSAGRACRTGAAPSPRPARPRHRSSPRGTGRC